MRVIIAVKTAQILGQILRNFPGSLEGEVKARIAHACYGVGLRVLGELLTDLREHYKPILETLIDKLREGHPQELDRELENRARWLLFGAVLLLSGAMVKLISHSVGSPDLEQTFGQVRRELSSPSVQLIDVSIKLDHISRFPLEEVIAIGKEFASLPLAASLLRLFVLEHFDLFPVDYKTRQRVCDKLGISFQRSQETHPDQKKIKA